MDLASIKVLYRAPDTSALYGIPYDMRSDVAQEPRHLVERFEHASNVPGWIYLGSPGWWGSIPQQDWAAIEAFLATQDIPQGPHEWCRVSPQ